MAENKIFHATDMQKLTKPSFFSPYSIMSDKNSHSLELSSMKRSESANRFQVNPVNHSANGTSREHEDDDDTFNENEAEMITKRRTSRIQSIKTSFKLDKQSKKETQARFTAGGDDSSDSNEDESLLDGAYDTKYGRSFRLVKVYKTVLIAYKSI